MSAQEIHVGDVNTTLRATVKDNGTVVDLSAGTITSIFFVLKNSVGTINTYTSSAFVTDGTDGKVDYTAATSIFDTTGTWQMQIIVQNGTTKHHSDINNFYVYKNLV